MPVRRQTAALDGDAQEGLWRTAILFGFLIGAFSSLVVSLGAGLAGRDNWVDWMIVGTILLRDLAVDPAPDWISVIVGVLTRQAAEVGWTFLFFGLAGRWTQGLQPKTLLALALAWAVATSAIEYYAILPWLQPLVTVEKPFGAVLSVRAAASLGYPLFPAIRGWEQGRPIPDPAFMRRWAIALGGLVIAIASLAGFEKAYGAPRWPFSDAATRAFEQDFLRHVSLHHEVGRSLAAYAAAKSASSRLRVLGELMEATQTSEAAILRGWWASWARSSMDGLSTAEQPRLAGAPTPAEWAELGRLTGLAFERAFIPVMIAHHQGAMAMAEEALQKAADPRIRLFARGLRHARRGEITLLSRYEPPAQQ